ncbi:hypothetical protein B4O97_12985 [Marispirochaeta aestuarii]|uniref:PilZ domain-containing protein n=1 Tax=Marispirochaeta aestuarii TaxID=1963862 RepID=A0A1Y1RXA4_9SPIO|nr:PilZ domain-containing protein [Marispirochaeta aestuarii]ORC34222.1 hypothetical protein B4O97_12985 [Marispirochaeta aestuarii]
MRILIQTTFQWKETDPVSMVIAGLIFAGFIVFLFIANAASRNSTGRPSSGGNRRFSRRSFYVRAKSLGLNHVQIKTLQNLIKRFQPVNPNNILYNSSQLDSLLRRGIQSIDGLSASDQQKENQKLQLYRIKQSIERNSSRKTLYSNTKQLTAGIQLVLTPEHGGRFQSKLLTNLKGSLAASVPLDAEGHQIRWKRWTKLNVFFWRSNGQGYFFTTKISGYGKVRSADALLLNHTSSITQAQQRKYRRRSIERPAYFFPVRIMTEGIGKDAKKRAYVEGNRGTLATMLDISSGGCSIRTSRPLSKGDLIKVDFETDQRSKISFYGKVMHTRKARPFGGVMHIMFTRISKRNLNNINAYIYNYSTS